MSLERALGQDKNEFTRDATIQRFEYTIELTWKTLKRYLETTQQLEIHNPKDLFREAGKQGMISSVEEWFGFLKARNLTSHTYNEINADEVYEAAKQFVGPAKAFLEYLEKALG